MATVKYSPCHRKKLVKLHAINNGLNNYSKNKVKLYKINDK